MSTLLIGIRNQDEIVYYDYPNREWGDQLTSYGGIAITYDALGNPQSYYNGVEYTLEWENRRLMSAYLDDEEGSSYYFSYDADGHLIYATLNGSATNYYYDGDLLMTIDAEFVDFHFFYDASGSPVGFAYRENSYSDDNYAFEYYWYEKNLEGDIVAIYDNSGNKVLSYVYYAWGNVTITEHGNVDEWLHLNPFTYRGYIYVKGFDMYYLGSRWYDPAIGRFISPDSVISGANGSLQGFNLYAYCFNNPVNMTDETGHWPEWMEKEAEGICNAAQWVSNNIVEPVVEAVTSTDWTYSIGLTGTISIGNFIFNGQVGLAADEEGNVALVISGAAGASSGTTGASIGGYHSITDAKDLSDLSGYYEQIGGAVGANGVVVGGDYITMYTPEGERHGLSVSAAVGTPGIEAHYMAGGALVISPSDIWDQIKIYF